MKTRKEIEKRISEYEGARKKLKKLVLEDKLWSIAEIHLAIDIQSRIQELDWVVEK